MATTHGTGRAHAHQQRTAERTEPVGRASNTGNGLPWLAGEITSIADEALAVWHEVADRDAGVLQAGGGTMARLLERIGWLSDTMTSALGGTPLRGADASDWTIPEAVRPALGPGKLRPSTPAADVSSQVPVRADRADVGPGILPQHATWLLFEHQDGRRAVCLDGEQHFTAGDPGWHRVGPVQVHAAPSRVLSTIPERTSAKAFGYISPDNDDREPESSETLREEIAYLIGPALDIVDEMTDKAPGMRLHGAAVLLRQANALCDRLEGVLMGDRMREAA